MARAASKRTRATDSNGYAAGNPFRVYHLPGGGGRDAFVLANARKSAVPREDAELVPVGQELPGPVAQVRSRLTLFLVDTRTEAQAFELGCKAVGDLNTIATMAVMSAEADCWGILVEQACSSAPTALSVEDRRARARGPQGAARAPLPGLEFVEDAHGLGGRAGRPKTVEGSLRLGAEILQFRAVASDKGIQLPGLDGLYEVSIRQ